jgi:Flp pilus assembly protein TadG
MSRGILAFSLRPSGDLRATSTVTFVARQSERGAAIAEFALAATFALALIFGILDFGRAFYDYHLVANAARMGSRYAIVNGPCSVSAPVCAVTQAEVQAYIQARSPGINTGSLTVSQFAYSAPATGLCLVAAQHEGCAITVSATYLFSFVVLPYAPITMTSTSKMIISQ